MSFLLDIDTQTVYQIQNIYIHFWEWFMLFILFIAFTLITHRKKQLRIEREPEYKYYVWGFYAKFFGVIFFLLIYYYFYNGGDTLRYFESSMSMANLFYKNPSSYFSVLFSPPTEEARSYFDFYTGFPYEYIFEDTKTYLVVKLISPLTIITGKSYLITSVLISYFTYQGIWKLYQLFYRYYPKLHFQLAIAILFLPSAIFWGSGVLKDSFTLMGTCIFTYQMHEIFILKKHKVNNYISLTIFSLIILGIKPYIFMLLFPGALFWIFYERISKFRKSSIAFLFIPIIIIFIGVFSVLFFSMLGDSLDKFSVEKALNTASVTQNDLKQEYYEGKSFDIGNFDGTPSSALRLFPSATIAGMIRPFLWEADSPFMILSAMENILIIYLIFKLILLYKPKRILSIIYNNPLPMFCMLFSLLFSFMLGITTSNYGALMRFKIPMLPFLISGLYILNYLAKNQKQKEYLKS